MDALRTILFVDDDESLLNSLRRQFYDDSYVTFFASSGESALELMKQQAIDIVVSDIKMSGMNGHVLLRKVQQLYPQTVRILFSGQLTISQEEISEMIKSINAGDVFKFVGKSAHLNQDVREAIEEAIELLKNNAETPSECLPDSC